MMLTIFEPYATASAIIANSAVAGYIQPLTGTYDENLEGLSEIEFVVATTERRYGSLRLESVVGFQHIDGRRLFFRIYSITTQINNTAIVKAKNVVYDASKRVIRPFQETSLLNTLSNITNQLRAQSTPITYKLNDIVTDNVIADFNLTIPRTGREVLGGYEGSIRDIYRIEYKPTQFTLLVSKHFGSDKGLKIEYGLNLVNYSHEQTNENVYDAVLGFAVIDGVTYMGNIYEAVVDIPSNVLIVDFSDKYSTENLPTTESLTTDAETYANANNITEPKLSFTVDFVDLSKSAEFKKWRWDLEPNLGDTVHVKIPSFSDEITARIIGTTLDLVADRYSAIQISNYRPTMYDAVEAMIQRGIKNARYV